MTTPQQGSEEACKYRLPPPQNSAERARRPPLLSCNTLPRRNILNIVTVPPDMRKRRTGRGSYNNFSITTIDDGAMPSNAQWKRAGNRTLMGTDVAVNQSARPEVGEIGTTDGSHLGHESAVSGSSSSTRQSSRPPRRPESGAGGASQGGVFITEGDAGRDQFAALYEDVEDEDEFGDEDAGLPDSMLDAGFVVGNTSAPPDAAKLRAAVSSFAMR